MATYGTDHHCDVIAAQRKKPKHHSRRTAGRLMELRIAMNGDKQNETSRRENRRALEGSSQWGNHCARWQRGKGLGARGKGVRAP